jgi:ElaB/YqjD/DUF883 family membrane-anchored ribosome-binding protein
MNNQVNGRIFMSEEADNLIRDLKVVAHDAEALIKATAGDMSEKAKDARARLSQAVASAKETALQLQSKAAEKAKVADEVVREHPYESVGVAFGVGVLLGLLFGRGRD